MSILNECVKDGIVNSKSYNFKLENTTIQIHEPSTTQIEYLEDVFYPTISTCSPPKKGVVKMQGTETQLSKSEIIEFVKNTNSSKSDKGYYYGNVSQNIKFVANPELGFVNLTFEDKDNISHRFVGIGTKFALASYTKAQVLWNLYEKESDMMISHSSSIQHLPSGKGIVLSTADRGDKVKRYFGKTTTALSMITRGTNEFSFCSNDEVILTINEGRIAPFALPNEISIIGSGLSQMFASTEMPRLIDWNEHDKIRDEVRYYTTHGDLRRAKYQVTQLQSIGLWAFVDLSLNTDVCVVQEVTPNEAFMSFDSVVFDDRMALAVSKDKFLGENANQLTRTNLPNVNTRRFFNLLENSAVKFVKISGSVNPNKIFTSISNIL